MPHRVLLDAVAGEPLHPLARDALLEAADLAYADPLRPHAPGRRARALLDAARERTAAALGVHRDEVTFTGSGTDAVHRGLLGLLEGRRRVARGLWHSAVEHSAVFAAARWWAQPRSGGTVAVLPVDERGVVRRGAGGALLVPPDAPPAGAVAVQLANAEVGTVQPVEEVAGSLEAPLFVDACAAAGRVDLPPGWAAAALSPRKWGGPGGVGILLVRRGARWRSPFPTDDRVDRRVAGFENVAAAWAAAVALEQRLAERAALDTRHARFADLVRRTAAALPDTVVHGDPVARLPHLVALSALYVDAEALLHRLDERGFVVASGSACAASSLEPSHVLVAMGALTQGNVRVSFTRDATEDDVTGFCRALGEEVAALRSQAFGAASGATR